MVFFFFLIRYIPFWAVPLLLISGEFAYIYWLKSKKKVSYWFMAAAIICFIFIIYYFLAGGHTKGVELLLKADREIRQGVR